MNAHTKLFTFTLGCAMALPLLMPTSALAASDAKGASLSDQSKLDQMSDTMQKMQAQIQAMQAELAAVRAQNAALEAKNQSTAQSKPNTSSKASADQAKSASGPSSGLIQKVADAVAKKNSSPIKIGGAVRFNYTLKQFDQNSRNTSGNLNFDTFRLNLDGQIDNVILSAEWRYYNYMQVIHHAWVGYKFSPNWLVRAGVVKVPFGNLPFNSNNYYFSSLYYAGLEDNYQLGLSTTYHLDNWRFDAAFLKNPQPNGFGNSSYSENVVGFDNGLDPSDPSYQRADAKPINTVVGRAQYTWKASKDLTLKPGISLMRGSLYGQNQREGDYHAYAAHLVADWRRWNLKLEYTDYDYALNNVLAKRLVYGAYAYNSYGPTSAKAVTAGVAYALPVNWGPISKLNFYNDYSRIYAKNDGINPTWMNVSGVSVVAGPVFAYFDFVQAKNQPFIGGNLAPAQGAGKASLNRLFNIDVGYYF